MIIEDRIKAFDRKVYSRLKSAFRILESPPTLVPAREGCQATGSSKKVSKFREVIGEKTHENEKYDRFKSLGQPTKIIEAFLRKGCCSFTTLPSDDCIG